MLALRPSEIDGDVLTFQVAHSAQALPKGFNEHWDSRFREGGRGQKADAGEARRLLRLAGKRHDEHCDDKKYDKSGEERGDVEGRYMSPRPVPSREFRQGASSISRDHRRRQCGLRGRDTSSAGGAEQDARADSPLILASLDPRNV